jgi:hypothetical protein
MPGVTRREQQQRWAETLASSAEEKAGNFGDRQKSSRGLSRQFLFHKDKIVSDEIEHLPGCEQRDGFPPCLHKPFSRNTLAHIVLRTSVPKRYSNGPHSILCAYKTVNQIHPVECLGGCECAMRGLRQGLIPAKFEFATKHVAASLPA